MPVIVWPAWQINIDQPVTPFKGKWIYDRIACLTLGVFLFVYHTLLRTDLPCLFVHCALMCLSGRLVPPQSNCPVSARYPLFLTPVVVWPASRARSNGVIRDQTTVDQRLTGRQEVESGEAESEVKEDDEEDRMNRHMEPRWCARLSVRADSAAVAVTAPWLSTLDPDDDKGTRRAFSNNPPLHHPTLQPTLFDSISAQNLSIPLQSWSQLERTY